MTQNKQLYLLTGDDTYALQERLRQLKVQLVEPDWEAFNLDTMEGDSVEASQIFDAWQTLPMGGTSRLIIVEYQRQPERLLQLVPLLLLPFKQSSNLNHLLLVSPSLDRRRKEVKELLQLPGVQHLEFSQIKAWNVEKELYPWIEEQVRRDCKRIARPAIERLVLAVGIDKNAIRQALDKLITYLGDAPMIEERIVRRLVQNSEADLFLLLELLANREREGALSQLGNLLLKEPPQKIIATLSTTLRNIYRLKQLQEQRKPLPMMAEMLNMKPFVVKKNLGLWKDYSFRDLEHRLRRLVELDTLTKKSRLPVKLALEMWVTEFLSSL